MQPMPITPIIHKNGTSAEELLRQQQAVIDAAKALSQALRDAMPNDRDYYPAGDEKAGYVARAEQLHRIGAAESIQKDAVAIILDIQNQMHG